MRRLHFSIEVSDEEWARVKREPSATQTVVAIRILTLRLLGFCERYVQNESVATFIARIAQ